MEPTFETYVGIDYSGADKATTRRPNIQVYTASATGDPVKTLPPEGVKWSRCCVASHLIGVAKAQVPFVAGIDHAFGFPSSYLDRHHVGDWPSFLADFVKHWPTHLPDATVESLRQGNERTGTPKEFRLTERWTSSAKSLFLFDVQGAVAKSSHAGIPWLAVIREQVGDHVHFWPFDGWEVPSGKSLIAEVYPSLWHHRYDKDDRSSDEHDAYSVARWLQEADAKGILGRYLDPPLSEAERRVAEREGWILGVT